MPDHLIRLRGGWERPGVPGGIPTSRVILPLVALPEGPGRIRLSRRFQAPAIDPARETLWLRLDSVPGLISVTLNDREIAPDLHGPSPRLIPLGVDLPTRNQLILEAEPPAPGSSFPPGPPWGEIALVIRRSESG